MARYLKEAAPRPPASTEAVAATVRNILGRVQAEGEAAVREFSRTLDQWDPPAFRVSDAQIEQAALSLDPALKADMHFAHDRVADFARRQRASMQEFEAQTLPGVRLGQKHLPVGSVGAYIPGGRYPLIAAAFMSILTAKVAGVQRVVACAPPRGDGIWPATLYAMHLAGADQIYAVGGVQALAAMAYGALPGLEAVDMIVGPGNEYVAEAKRQLFGTVGIDLLAGPTEIMIIADATADPYVVAADLIGQAEHDPRSRAALVTTSAALAEAVLAEVPRQLPEVETEAVARTAWEQNGEIIVVADDAEAVAVADAWAPEHLQVQAKDPQWFLQRLHNYGSLFLGEEATVLYSDKAMGTNHTLPTLGAARYTGGLWVGKFLKTVTYQALTREGSNRVAPPAMGVAGAEGMMAHVRTGRIRLDRYGGQTGG